jgi:Rrf2 family protein
MKLSMRAEYGVRAIFDLAERYGDGTVGSSDIASRQQIPPAFLDQVLLALRKAGLVHSVRGPRGGHLLGRPPRDITLQEVIAALEGTSPPTDCQREGHPGTLACILHRVMARADRAVREVLEAQTLEELLREHRAARPVYHGIFKPQTGPRGERRASSGRSR